MAHFVKRYMERVADVPTQLRRRLALVRDLDEKSAQLQRDIAEQVKQMLDKEGQQGGGQQDTAVSPAAKKQRLENQPPAYDIELSLRKLISLADEKTGIASQVYDFVDKHIMQLDEDLRALEGEVRADRADLGLKEGETACDRLGIELPKVKVQKTELPVPEAELKGKKGKRKQKKSLGKEDLAAAVPLDVAALEVPVPNENEPLYCICQKPSYGEMVACENPDCQVEWFHYACVGLTDAPTGDWFCPSCRQGR